MYSNYTYLGFYEKLLHNIIDTGRELPWLSQKPSRTPRTWRC